MTDSGQSFRRTFRLADRLAAAWRGRFVGREPELELFRSAILADESPFVVLYIYGPGGIGKTTLLRQYARMADGQGIPVMLLDGRDVEPSPPGFELALREALELEETASPLRHLAQSSRSVVLIDTFEALDPLDDWLRKSFLPQMPGRSLVVLAGRRRPATSWRSDLEWAPLTRFVSLRNLRPEESRSYLEARGVPEDHHQDVLSFTHGHPLALSLVADVASGTGEKVAFSPQQEPDVVATLLDRFVQQIPGPTHRRALEVCAHVRLTTEGLLASVLDLEDAHDIFEWLRGLSFIEQGAQGLYPHDLAREVLDVDFRWRNPQAYRSMHHRVRKALDSALANARGKARQSVMTEITYLYRHNAVTRMYYDWDALGKAHTEPATPEYHGRVLEAVQHHEGTASTDVARFWLQRQPDAFTVFLDGDDRFMGFICMLVLPGITAEDSEFDPAMAAASEFMQRFGPLRPDETFNYVRFWMGREKYQVAELHNLVTETAGAVFRSGDPGLAWSFAAVADPLHWQPLFAHLNFAYTEEADFTVGERRFGVFTHDWRREPLSVWSKIVGERQLAGELEMTQEASTGPAPLLVLSEPEFAEAVHQALRDYTRPELLSANPLMRSRLLVETAAEEISPAALQALLHQAVDTLTGNPRDEKFHRAIYRTYLIPAPSQEAAAELLDLPLGTYRYRLARGVERITQWLWQRELHDFTR